MEEWDRVAWLCFFMPRFSKKKFKVEDFHPLRGVEKQISISQLNKAVAEAGKHLPKHLSNEEIDKRWEKRKEKWRKDAGVNSNSS